MTKVMKDRIRIVVLQHSKDTPPGSLRDWAHAQDLDLDVRLLHEGHSLPQVEHIDWLIILGGPMNVDDTDQHPWLIQEKALIAAALAQGKTILGICLGGQLLAQVAGGSVRQHDHWEIGWFPVTFDNDEVLTVFQWHQDTFELPPNAELMAGNEVTKNQAFRLGQRVLGTQFHPEATTEWVQLCSTEAPYPTGPYVQTPADLTQGSTTHLPEMRRWFFRILNEFKVKTLEAMALER